MFFLHRRYFICSLLIPVSPFSFKGHAASSRKLLPPKQKSGASCRRHQVTFALFSSDGSSEMASLHSYLILGTWDKSMEKLRKKLTLSSRRKEKMNNGMNVSVIKYHALEGQNEADTGAKEGNWLTRRWYRLQLYINNPCWLPWVNAIWLKSEKKMQVGYTCTNWKEEQSKNMVQPMQRLQGVQTALRQFPSMLSSNGLFVACGPHTAWKTEFWLFSDAYNKISYQLDIQ